MGNASLRPRKQAPPTPPHPGPESPGRAHLLDVHVLQEGTVGLQDRQGGLLIILIVTASALPALGLLNGDDLKCREAPQT